jgi:pimeloyl-ACP methyl ester carboxylesterase
MDIHPRGSLAGSEQIFGSGTLSRRDVLGAAVALAGGGISATAAVVTDAEPAELPEPVKVIPVPPQAPAVEGLLDVGGAHLWFWDTGGKGIPVVLSHPATGSGATWGYQQPAFAEAGYRVIGYSRRGHFKSTISDAQAGVTDLADLRQLVDHLGISRFHLLGSAAGAFLAAQFAVTYPQNLASVVLSSSLISIQDREYQDLIARLLPPSFAMMPPEFRELGPSYRAANPEGTARWLELEQAARGAGAIAASPSIGGTAVTFANLGALRVPMLLLTGACDLYACPALLIYVARRLGKKSVAIVNNAGHAAYWEQPEAYNRIVMRFLSQHG